MYKVNAAFHNGTYFHGFDFTIHNLSTEHVRARFNANCGESIAQNNPYFGQFVQDLRDNGYGQFGWWTVQLEGC